MRTYAPIFSFFPLLFCAHIYAKIEILAEYVDNYDGDTVRVNLPELKKMDKDGKYSLFWDKISVRIGGIDTPEIKGNCSNETELAKRAKSFVRTKLEEAKKVTIAIEGPDKYFRILGGIYADGVPLAQMLMDEGYAVPYDGGTKKNTWCGKIKKQKSQKH
jgi:micrococcal nuclease